jgi:nucleoid-associated protein YgaU
VLLTGLLLAAAPVGSQSADAVHVVQPGETLWQIAANLSGNPHRWPEIYRANRDQIKDPSKLYPGQRLAIPDFTRDAPRDGASRETPPPGGR